MFRKTKISKSIADKVYGLFFAGVFGTVTLYSVNIAVQVRGLHQRRLDLNERFEILHEAGLLPDDPVESKEKFESFSEEQKQKILETDIEILRKDVKTIIQV